MTVLMLGEFSPKPCQNAFAKQASGVNWGGGGGGGGGGGKGEGVQGCYSQIGIDIVTNFSGIINYSNIQYYINLHSYIVIISNLSQTSYLVNIIF